MSSTLRHDGAEPRGGVAQWLFVIWAALVFVAYLMFREEDLTPALASLAARACDVAVPVLLLALYLPGASWLVRRSGLGVSGAGSHLLLSATLAVGLLIIATTALGVAGVLRPWALCVVAGIAGVLPCGEGRRLHESLRGVRGAFVRVAKSPAGILWGVIAVLSLPMALTPAVSQDALHYHLSVPSAWLAAGAFDDVPGNIYSRLPMNVELLFLNGLALRGEIAAKVFHWLLAMLAAVSLRQLCARFTQRDAATWAAVIFLSIPTVFRVATWAYVEMGMVLFLATAWLAILETPRVAPRHAALIGLLLGLACGTKYTLLAPAAVMAAVVVFRGRPRLAVLAVGLGAGFIGGGFWYLRNWLEVGNPLFPFLYSVFGGTGWDAARAQVFMEFLSSWGEGGWTLPFALTFEATFYSIADFDGVVGPVFLLALPLVALALWKRPGTRGTGAIALVLLVCWASATLQVRFLVPTLAFLAVLIPVGWQALEGARPRAFARGLVQAAVLVALVSPLLIFSRDAPLAFALGMESGDQLRARLVPGNDYELFRRLPQVVPADGRVLFAGSGNPVFLCKRSYHADSVVENHTLRALLTEGGSAAGFVRAFRDAGYTHLLFRLPLVFDEHSDLSDEERFRLAEALNRHGTLELQADATVLFRVELVGKAVSG